MNGLWVIVGYCGQCDYLVGNSFILLHSRMIVWTVVGLYILFVQKQLWKVLMDCGEIIKLLYFGSVEKLHGVFDLHGASAIRYKDEYCWVC